MSGYACDLGRLVIQCACERTARWTAIREAWAAPLRAFGVEVAWASKKTRRAQSLQKGTAS